MPNRIKQILVLPLAAIVSLLITSIGQGVWGALVAINMHVHSDLPWAVPIMAAVLIVLLRYLSGWGWPGRSSETRRKLLRWNVVEPRIFGWAVLSGVLGLVALGGLWIAVSDIVHLPPGTAPGMRGYPLQTAISFLIMGSLAAPLTEEAAFRGYAQGMLERAWGSAPAAIVGSSVLFAAAHFPQGIDPTKLGLYFVAGLLFGTIAYLTNSLYAAMLVHALGDVEGFLLLWPHDAQAHALITEGGYDLLFLPAIFALAAFGPLCIWAFIKLARIGRTLGGSRFQSAL